MPAMRLAPVIFLFCALGTAAAPLSFNRDIRPILSNNCYQCHGPDSAARKANLRLDNQAGSRAKLKSGAKPIIPGSLDDSELIYRITATDGDERMPPANSNKHLTPKQIALLKDWVKEGGKYEAHWSFTPPAAAALPKVKQADWPRNGIDHFILARLESEGLTPASAAD